jgi:hypothetical protein
LAAARGEQQRENAHEHDAATAIHASEEIM